MTDYTGRVFPSKTLYKAFGYIEEPTPVIETFQPQAPGFSGSASLSPGGGSGGTYINVGTAEYNAQTYAQLQQRYGQVAYTGGSYWAGL